MLGCNLFLIKPQFGVQAHYVWERVTSCISLVTVTAVSSTRNLHSGGLMQDNIISLLSCITPNGFLSIWHRTATIFLHNECAFSLQIVSHLGVICPSSPIWMYPEVISRKNILANVSCLMSEEHGCVWLSNVDSHWQVWQHVVHLDCALIIAWQKNDTSHL